MFSFSWDENVADGATVSPEGDNSRKGSPGKAYIFFIVDEEFFFVKFKTYFLIKGLVVEKYFCYR